MAEIPATFHTKKLRAPSQPFLVLAGTLRGLEVRGHHFSLGKLMASHPEVNAAKATSSCLSSKVDNSLRPARSSALFLIKWPCEAARSFSASPPRGHPFGMVKLPRISFSVLDWESIALGASTATGLEPELLP